MYMEVYYHGGKSVLQIKSIMEVYIYQQEPNSTFLNKRLYVAIIPLDPQTSNNTAVTQQGVFQDESSRLPFPQINTFRKFVVQEFGRRKLNYPTSPVSPFLRLTSCNIDTINNYIFFTLGLHGLAPSQLPIFDLSYGSGREVVGYAVDLDSKASTGLYKPKLIYSDMLSADALPPSVAQNFDAQFIARINNARQQLETQSQQIFGKGTHPIPGLTGANVKLFNYNNAQITKVYYTCYDRAQFEFLRNHFMIAGNYVVLEWGNEFSDFHPTKMLNFYDPDTTRGVLVNAVNQGRSYITQNYVQPNNGNYNFIVGQVGNFGVDLDASTSKFNCNITIYSVGEMMYSLSNHFSRTNKEFDPTDVKSESISTFNDFFKIGSIFDSLIEYYRIHDNSMVAQYKENWSSEMFEGGTFKGVSTNHEDYRFVSWKFFTTIVIPALYQTISKTNNPNVNNIRTDGFDFLRLYQNEPIPTTQQEADRQDWVGDNTYLRSTDPDVILIMKSNMKNTLTNQTKGLETNGYFDTGYPFSKGYRGKLSSGVWINAGKIREVFHGTNNFHVAIQQLLTYMNTATADYWGLELHWNEEKSYWQVIDSHHTDSDTVRKLSFYKFNVGGKGEAININLDSAFPPETIAMMALHDKAVNNDQPNADLLQNTLPALGLTNNYIFALNWTNLDNITNKDLNLSRTSGPNITPLIQPQVIQPAVGLQPDQANNDRTITKIGSIQSAGTPTLSTLTSPKAGQEVGNTQVTSTAADATATNFQTRNSTTPTPNPQSANIINNSKKWDSFVNDAASKHNVDPDLIRAVIQNESGFRTAPDRYEPVPDDTSRGPMQILLHTARLEGFMGTPEQLEDPKTNIDVSTKYLRDCLAQTNNDIPSALSMYNGAFRPSMGFGAPSPIDQTVCLEHNPDKTCKVASFVQAGTFANQGYVNKGVANYNIFRKANNLPPFDDKLPSQNTPDRIYGDPTLDQQIQQNKEDVKAEEDYTSRFGDGILNLIYISTSSMIAKITHDGYKHYPTPNSYVSPYPIDSTVTIETLGISGMSIGDGFYVDKLPFIFEQCGIFRIVEITDNITETGWTTNTKGRFMLTFLNHEGATNTPLTGIE